MDMLKFRLEKGASGHYHGIVTGPKRTRWRHLAAYEL